MDNNRIMRIILVITWVAMLYILLTTFRQGQQNQQSPQVAQKPLEVIEQVKALEQDAGDDKEKLKQVLKGYQEIAKKNKNTEVASEALFRSAVIYETKLEDNRRAIAGYKSVIDDYPPAEYKFGEDAKVRLEALRIRIDREKSSELGYKFIDFLVSASGRDSRYSYAIALLIITAIIKIITTPLSKKQYQNMKEMQKIQPFVKQLQEKYKGNQKELGERTMALYKEHGINPFAGCLPLLIQMPILLLLYYKVILAYEYQFTKAQFLWIGSHITSNLPSQITIFGYKVPFIAENLAQPDLLLLLLYTVSMIISQKLTVVDPAQSEQQKMMMYMLPIFFAFILMSFPSALLLYWLLFNIFSTVQQYFIMKAHPDTGIPTAGGTSGGNTGGGNGKAKQHVPAKVRRRKQNNASATPYTKPIAVGTCLYKGLAADLQ